MVNLTRARSACSPSEALGGVLRELQTADLSSQSTQRMAELMARFTIFIEKGFGLRAISEIAEEHVEGFVFASFLGQGRRRRPTPATMHLRRSALRLYFRIARSLKLDEGDPTVDLVLPVRSCLAVRPLADDEIVVCRSYAMNSLTATNRPAAWALAEATARTSEIPFIALSDLDFEGGRVWLHGSSKAEARWGHLTRWGYAQLRRRVHELAKSETKDPLLVYRGMGSEQSRQAASCIAVTETLTRAGFASEPDVRPHSVMAWAGTKIFEQTGCIGEVANRLGMRSLDQAARLIGWEWSAFGSDASKNA